MSTNRFDNLPDDNTGRLVTQQHVNAAFAATIAVVVTAQKTTIVIAQLTGDVTLNLTEDLAVGALQEGDEITIMASADGSTRTITFGTKITAVDLVLLTGENGVVTGVYDGTNFLAVVQHQDT